MPALPGFIQGGGGLEIRLHSALGADSPVHDIDLFDGYPRADEVIAQQAP
jgi:hypothetical protein